MSALLDALKKAAEDKRIKQEGVLNNSTLNLDSLELNGIAPLSSESTSHVTKDNQPFSLNLTTDDDLDVDFRADNQPEQEKESLSTEVLEPFEVNMLPASQVEPLSDESPSSTSSIPFRLAEESSNTTDDQEDIGIANFEKSPPLDFRLTDIDLLSVDDKLQKSIGVEFQDSQDAGDKENSRLEEDVEERNVHFESKFDSLAEETKDALQDFRVQDVKIEEDSRNLEGRQEDFDWSLGNIPAYKKEENVLRKNSSNILQGLAKSNRVRPSQKSKWILWFLLFLLFLTSMMYYLLDYYESSQKQANQTLKRYELVETPTKLTRNEVDASKTTIEKVEQNKNLNTPVRQNSVDKHIRVDSIDSSLKQEGDVKPLLHKPSNNAPLRDSKISAVMSENKASPSKVLNDQKQVMSSSDTAKNNALVIKRSDAVVNEQVAYDYYLLRDYSKSKEYYLKALKENPESISTLCGLGAIAIQNGETQLALNFYTKASQLDPQNPKVMEALLVLRSENGRYEDWIGPLKSHISKWPNSASLHFALGNLYARHQDWLSAQESYFKALELMPNNGNYALNLAVSLDNLGQYLLAKQYYQSFLALSGSQPFSASSEQVKARVVAIERFLALGSSRGK